MAMQRVRDGDFSAELPADWDGMPGKLAEYFNEIVRSNRLLAQELRRVG